MLVRFLAKRVALLAALCVIIPFFVPGLGAMASFGILLGAFTSLYKIKLFGTFLDGLFKLGSVGKKPFIYQIFSQLLVFGLLTVAIIADFRLFIGVTAGLLLTPLYICINAFTEKVALTHNAWGQKEEMAVWKK